MNLSLGHLPGESYKTDPLCQAAEKAYRAGIVVVCAAGNTGRANDTAAPGQDNEGFGSAYGSIQSPGNSPYVITVGAMKSGGAGRNRDRIATYSSRGPSRLDFVLKPDIIAPGNRVVAATADKSYLDTRYQDTNGVGAAEYMNRNGATWSRQYFRLSGTSMACPVVSGAVALLLQVNPTLSPDTVKARLMISADKWAAPDGTSDPCTYGAGYLNIPAALRCPIVANAPAASPLLMRDADGGVRIAGVNGTQVLWGTQILWGSQIIWGSQVLWGAGTGAPLLSSSNVIWGSSVWGDRDGTFGEMGSAADLSMTAIQGEE